MTTSPGDQQAEAQRQGAQGHGGRLTRLRRSARRQQPECSRCAGGGQPRVLHRGIDGHSFRGLQSAQDFFGVCPVGENPTNSNVRESPVIRRQVYIPDDATIVQRIGVMRQGKITRQFICSVFHDLMAPRLFFDREPHAVPFVHEFSAIRAGEFGVEQIAEALDRRTNAEPLSHGKQTDG